MVFRLRRAQFVHARGGLRVPVLFVISSPLLSTHTLCAQRQAPPRRNAEPLKCVSVHKEKETQAQATLDQAAVTRKHAEGLSVAARRRRDEWYHNTSTG
jgi:hypothetical protein